MAWVGKLLSNFKGFYNEINSATLTGAIDVVVVQEEDGSYVGSPFHVRFGKLGVLRSREKVVDIEINGQPVDLHMKLGEAGEAFFVQEAKESAEVPAHLATSPIPSTIDLMEKGIKKLKQEAKQKSKSEDLEPTDTEYKDNEVETHILNNTQLQTNITDFTTIKSDSQLESRENDNEMGLIGDLIKGEGHSPTPSVSLPNIKLENERNTVPETCDQETESKKESNLPSDHASLTRLKRKKRRVKKKVNHHDNSTSSLREKSDESVVNINNGANKSEDEDIFEMDVSGDESHSSISLHSMARTVSLPIIKEDHWMLPGHLYGSGFHPFSDGDITPILSPVGTRPPTPKSDTEFEVSTHHQYEEDPDELKWEWGELPTPQRSQMKKSTAKNNETNEKNVQDDEKTDTGGLFQFMRQTKKIRHQPEQEGIYLDDLKLEEMDPEIAALYLYQTKGNSHQMMTIKDEDSESGHGMSLPQSPVSMDRDQHNYSSIQKTMQYGMSDIAMSLCGGLKESDGEVPRDKFLQHLVTYEDFCKDPNMLTNGNLVMRIGEKYYNWQAAGPILMSVLVFQQPLNDTAVETLLKQHMSKKDRKKSSWYWWGGSGKPDKSMESSAIQKDDALSPPSSVPSSPPSSPLRSKIRPKPSAVKEDGSMTDEEVETIKSTRYVEDKSYERYQKSVRLSSEQLACLNLKEGPNEITYSVTTSYQGTTRCTSFIYLWHHDDKVIISDIDGTITKSDVLGQVLPMFGKDWSQTGIANLYNAINNNGYKFLYLSARAIGQATVTRDYLRSIRQGELSLPDGPLFLSPSSLIHAFHKEVIERKPEEFKIQCLRDVAALFPPTRNPFYAGYGNKINDVWSYRAVGIPISRIFTVNHRGELRHELTQTFQSTYTHLSDVVDHMFPPLLHRSMSKGTSQVQAGNFHAPDEFSTFTYWREPIADIEIDLDLINKKSASETGNKDKK